MKPEPVVPPILEPRIDDSPGPSYCGFCRHYDASTRRCAAFLEGIPVKIYYGEADHRKPFEGDGGIRFEGVAPGDEELVEVMLEVRRKEPISWVEK